MDERARLRALAGRAYIYVGAGGQAVVAKAIELIRKELEAAMALIGRQDNQGNRPAGAGELMTPSLSFHPRHQLASQPV